MHRNLFWIFLLFSLSLGACTPTRSSEAPFPIIGNDQSGLVEAMEWGVTPALIPFPPDALTVLEILDTSTPEVVQIAVEGGVCPPSAQVLVTGPPETVRVSLILGASIAPEGTECGEILTTHALVIRFREPIALSGLEVSAERTGEVADE